MLYLDILKRVLVKTKGCPEDEAASAMRQACIEFCTETRCLTSAAQVQTMPGESGVMTVSLEDLWPIDIVDARINGEPVSVVAMNDDRVEAATSACPVIVFADPSALTLVPSPTTTVTVDLLVSVAPGVESDSVPDVLWQRHSEALESGALSRLLAEPDKTWSDAALAAWHDGKFQAAITKQAALSGKNRITRAQRLRVKPA